MTAGYRRKPALENKGNISKIRGRLMKKTYEKPAIVHTEKLEARAVVCAKADANSCGSGPIQS